jgi:hypothetical protein
LTPQPGQDQGAPPVGAPPIGAPPPPPTPQPSWAELFSLYRNDRLRGMRIDLETDQTIAPDPEAKQQAVATFMTALGTYLQQALPAVAMGQLPADVAGQMLLWSVRQFDVARDLEATLEDWVEQLASGQAQIQPPPPDPMLGVEQDKLGLERDRMAQEAEGAEADRQFQREQADAERQAQAQAEQAKQKGPPFLMGEDGIVAAGDLTSQMQAQFEAEMQGISQALTQMMQMQAQQNQMMMQVLQQILIALGQPKMKQVATQTDQSGRVVGARVIEQPMQPNGGAPV